MWPLYGEFSVDVQGVTSVRRGGIHFSKNEAAVHYLDQVLVAAPKGLEVILFGDLNIRIR